MAEPCPGRHDINSDIMSRRQPRSAKGKGLKIEDGWKTFQRGDEGSFILSESPGWTESILVDLTQRDDTGCN